MKNEPLTSDQIIDKILNAKGRFVKVAYRSNPTPAASFKEHVLEKRTIAIVRAGVGFGNIKEVKEGIASGERGPVGPLPYGEWVKYPYVIRHKGELQLRLTRSYEHTDHSIIKYYVDDVEVPLDEFVKYLTPSGAKAALSDDLPPIFNIKMNNVLDITE